METVSESRRPNERLADEITAALVESGLFPEQERVAAYERIASGGARPEDWINWAEAAALRSKGDLNRG